MITKLIIKFHPFLPLFLPFLHKNEVKGSQNQNLKINLITRGSSIIFKNLIIKFVIYKNHY